MALQTSTTVFTAALCLCLSYILLRRNKQKHVFPPGPIPKPIIGNTLDMPLRKPWLKFLEWSKTYDSDILHINVLNNHFLILNKLEDIVEVLDRRSRTYSSRPPNAIAEMLGITTLTPLLAYGDAFKKQRRFFEENLKRDAIQSYRHVLEEKVHLLLDNLLKDPAGFEKHCNMVAASINLATTFGYDIIPGKKKDHFVIMGQYAVTSTSELSLPGRTLIAAFPFLRHIPPWFPGASTQNFGAKVREAFVHYKTGSLAYVKDRMASGTAKDSILRRLIERGGKDGSAADPVLLDAAYTLYLGAVETTEIVLTTFILAMTLHPVAQKKAQEEIDRVVGSDRLPTYDDRPSLPYVEAIYREISRWRPVTPIAFPHSTDEDDIYKGYFIPKGNCVLNFYSESVELRFYPRDHRRSECLGDPESFKPERFIKADGTLTDDTAYYIFGFGRRICPGRYMADMVVWLTIVTVLATFNISKAKDENGKEIPVSGDVNTFTDAITSHPKPFKCSILPRSQLSKMIVEDTAEAILQSLRAS